MKVIGYALSVLGLILILIRSLVGKTDALNIFKQINPKILLILGILFVISGSIIALKSKKERTKKKKELPIYEGEKIVGYRRA